MDETVANSGQSLSVSTRVGEALKTSRLTVSTAESCTGGLIAHLLTEISGSSAYVMGGIVAYHNDVKQSVLGVQLSTLMEYGAVSEAVAREMAAGARALFGTDYAVSVTGIAGPGGGTDDKPVGLTYIGVSGPKETVVEKHIWTHDRGGNKAASADAALRLLLHTIEHDTA
jgi:PncC family amidohydrolase